MPTGRFLPSRTETKTPTTQLLSWFTFTGSLGDKGPPLPDGTKRTATLGPGAVLDPDTKSFVKVDGRGWGWGDGKRTVTINRAGPEFNLPEFTVSLFYFIEYLYSGGATGSQMCSWQRILSHRAFDFEINTCNYPKPYIKGGPIKFEQFPAPKKWTHVALTRSPTESKFYYNGVLAGTAPSPPLPTDLSTEQVLLGLSLYGAVDDFRFYRGVLDAAAIAALTQAGHSIEKPNVANVPIAPTVAK